MKKKIGTFLTLLCMCLLLMGTDFHLQAATGKTSVAVSAGTVNIGDTVKITAMAAGPSGEKTVATMTISYDSSVFSFVNCSADYSGGGGSVTATSDRFTITLKAVAEGSSKIALAASGGVVSQTNEALDSMEGSSTTIKVSNAASANAADDTKLSADNSLKALSISPGTLSPAFAGKTVQYTATVANDVTRVEVSATPANEKATVESVTGNENLSVGNNAVKIVVKAENGVTATYTITVTRQETAASSEKSEEPEVLTEEPLVTTGETVTVGGISYGISGDFTADVIPAGCSEATVSYHGTDYKGVNFAGGNLSLLYLVPQQTSDSASARFFIYDATGDGFYPFIQLKHGDNFIIWLPNPAEYTAAEGEQQVDITVNAGEIMTVNKHSGEETSDFSFFYAVNQDGTTGWYQYDSLEQTYQRKQTKDAVVETAETEETENVDSNLAYFEEEYSTLENEMKKEKSFSRTAIGVLIFIVAVLIIIIINLILQRRGDSEDFDDYEEEIKPQPKKKANISQRSSDEFEDVPQTKKVRNVKHFSDDFEDDLEEKEVKTQKKPRFAKYETDDLEKKETKTKDNYEETRKHETVTKSKDGIEVIDFNDL